MKLQRIKEKLAQILVEEVQMSVIKTDKNVLSYDGDELIVGMPVYIEDENGERLTVEDGQYVTEDNKVITVADGKVVSIVEKEEEKEEEEPKPAEEPAEEPKEDVKAEDAPEGTEGKTGEDAPKEEEKDNIAELTQRVEVLEGLVKELVAAMELLKTETLAKMNMSAAKPAIEEFEQIKNANKTGDSKLDKFLSRYGNK